MDFFAEHEIVQASNWFCNAQPQQNDTDKIMEISPIDGFFEFNWATEFSDQSNHLDINEFIDLENFNFDFNLPHFHEHFEVYQNPINAVLPVLKHCKEKGESIGESSFVETLVKKEEEDEIQEESQFPLPLAVCSSSSARFIRRKTSPLQFDEIKEHFDVPIKMAAKRLNIGVTLLKKRCRELNITRWPHRKFKSLNLLMDNLKEMGWENEVAKLEKHKKMLDKIPNLELNEETKKLRQACFKSCYKKRKLLIKT